MQVIAAHAAGLVFGLGIAVSGMGNPAKVLNFFDVAGTWDPSLALVMAGALAVTIPGYRLALGRTRPLLAETFSLPAIRRIELPLLWGSAVFGIGWGLSGFCPGGLVPVLFTGHGAPLIFFAGLVAGLVATRHLRASAARSTWGPQGTRSARG